MPVIPSPWPASLEGESAPVVGDAELDPVAVARARPTLHVVGAGVADGVRERLLGDPVDDQLGVAPAASPSSPSDLEARPSTAPWRASSRDVARERRLEPEVVERGRAQLAGQRQQLLHRLVGERPDLGELGGELGRRLLARRLEPQQQARSAPG